jgi:hypothetical protein
VKNCQYPTPWRPKHGSNKETWQHIADCIHERPDVFDAPIVWESAKDQLMKIIERFCLTCAYICLIVAFRQKLRRSLGDFTVKNETEAYVDEMIKHVRAA